MKRSEEQKDLAVPRKEIWVQTRAFTVFQSW